MASVQTDCIGRILDLHPGTLQLVVELCPFRDISRPSEIFWNIGFNKINITSVLGGI